MEKIYDLFLECSGISTDTRTLEKDNLFICLRGENFNGNKFAQEAIQKGAKYVLIDDAVFYQNEKTILVKNCLETLQQLAHFHRKKFNIPVIGITGSNGKTTTKELTAHLLSSTYAVLYTKGNLNNHIGVPLTLLKLKEKHQIAIIEMGANHPNDIQELCEIAEPNYGIISNIGKAHLLGFKNIAGVIQAKTALYRAVENNQGFLFINIDDAILLQNIQKDTAKVTYSGIGNKEAFITGKLIKLTPLIYLKWANKTYQSPAIETQIIGEYNFYNLLAAITIANYFQVEPEKINTAISCYRNENNRSQLRRTKTNELIMDAYNANPSSTQSAINSFQKIERTNKLMILGDMFELGEESSKEHETIIALANSTQIKTFFIGESFFEHANGQHNFYKNKEDFKAFLHTNTIQDTLILLKGSRGIALESLVDFL